MFWCCCWLCVWDNCCPRPCLEEEEVFVSLLLVPDILVLLFVVVVFLVENPLVLPAVPRIVLVKRLPPFVVAVFKIDVAEGANIQARKNLFISNFSSDYSKVESSTFPTKLSFINTISTVGSDSKDFLGNTLRTTYNALPLHWFVYYRSLQFTVNAEYVGLGSHPSSKEDSCGSAAVAGLLYASRNLAPEGAFFLDWALSG